MLVSSSMTRIFLDMGSSLANYTIWLGLFFGESTNSRIKFKVTSELKFNELITNKISGVNGFLTLVTFNFSHFVTFIFSTLARKKVTDNTN
jgi:hypothetical protein